SARNILSSQPGAQEQKRAEAPCTPSRATIKPFAAPDGFCLILYMLKTDLHAPDLLHGRNQHPRQHGDRPL
ncbi:MAG: hypothetical protein ABF436_12315, partial [Acetobacter okinawensis]|uniref:hypothetical protein n=1 Tax=Acetobacter okinawensis TaxID=1076594 RepID=UPI0039E7E1B4